MIGDVAARLGELGLVRVGPRDRAAAATYHGTVDGQDVHVSIAPRAGASPRVVLESALTPALDLGLVIRRVPPRLAGGIAIARLVDEHRVAGDEPVRVQQLVGGAVADAARLVAELGGDLDLDDACARVAEPRDVSEVPELLRALARLTMLVDDAAAALPPAGALAAAAERWRPVAAAEGLTWRSSPLSMHGARSAASTRRLGPHAFTASAWAGHPAIAELGLSLRRAGVGEPRAVSPVGEADGDLFASVFTVVARDPRVAGRMLDGPTRRALVELALVGDVRLDETGLALGDVRPEDVPRALELMRRALDGAVENLREVAGPYR